MLNWGHGFGIIITSASLLSAAVFIR
ncbi:MAG: hypothetical protein J7L04_07385 [Bacteroidales bacterium]|nr:hypothetical protein [Bacteroidales bacterium]